MPKNVSFYLLHNTLEMFKQGKIQKGGTKDIGKIIFLVKLKCEEQESLKDKFAKYKKYILNYTCRIVKKKIA